MTVFTSGTARTTAGAGALLRFLLQRDRVRLSWWVLGAAALLAIQSVQSQRIYDTPEDLAKLRETAGDNAAVVAMGGPEELLSTVGGEVVFEIFAYLAIVIGLMNMFLVGRHTRADEEAGRSELLRSAPVGRHAGLAAVLLLALLTNAGLAVTLFVVATGTGLPAGGSLLLSLAAAALGLVFAALTAVLAQIFENPRSVYGAVTAALGSAYALRAIGDVGAEALSWTSPIGWGQRTLPYAGDRWWPLLLPVGAALGLAAAAVATVSRRDFGAGLLASRPGRPAASPLLGSPFGLAWRLQRASLAAWSFGVLLLGVAYGSVADAIEDYVADNPDIAEFLPGGGDDLVDAYLALTLGMQVLLASAFGVSAVLRARAEELSGRAEMVLATATSRGAWLGGHLALALGGTALVLAAGGAGEGLSYGITISDAGQVARLAGAALTYLPAVWTVVAIAVLGMGWLPRAAAAGAWAFVGFSALVVIFGDSLEMPTWMRDISPVNHIAQAPLDGVAATPLLLLGALTAGLLAGGAIGLSRRDLGQ